ncbi:MAG: PmoA family protein [Paludibaculum sp.]
MNRRHFLALAAASASSSAQTTRDAAAPARSRQRRNFNTGWLFRRQANGGGALGSWERDPTLGAAIEPAFRNASQPTYDDSTWSLIRLPHTWNQHDGSDEQPGYFRGIGWYRKHFVLESTLRGQCVFLEFEGANQVMELWINGAYLGKHEGGYTSFEFDITPHVQFGAAANVLTAKVDNIYNKDIAPTVKTDLTFYGGIYRDAWLRITAPIHLSEVYWLTPKVSESEAAIEIHSRIDNRSTRAATLKTVHELIDPQGAVAAKVESNVAVPAGIRGHALKQQLTLARPSLWSPDTPNLYRLRTTLLDPSGPGDTHEVPIGFRWFHFDAQQGFFLNGRRLQLRGTTWHQSYPGLGSALPNSRHTKDMELIREMGCNLFRTSHYPHDPAVMQACDRLGLLVLEEMFVGEEVEDDGGYYRIQAKGIEEMIARDRNHPCVFMWGLEGEVESAAKHVEVVQQLVNKIKATDPSRPATMQDARIDSIKQTLDVVGLYSSFEANDKERSLHPERRYMIEEYTVDSIGRGIYGMGPDSEDLGCEKHEAYLAEVGRRPWIAGSTVWHQFDYDGEEYDPVMPHLVTFGLADFWRIPKDAFYLFQSQWSAKPMLHLCGHWTWPGEVGKTRKVKIYSNQARVRAFSERPLAGRPRACRLSGPRSPAVPLGRPLRTGHPESRRRRTRLRTQNRRACRPHRPPLRHGPPRIRRSREPCLSHRGRCRQGRHGRSLGHPRHQLHLLRPWRTSAPDLAWPSHRTHLELCGRPNPHRPPLDRSRRPLHRQRLVAGSPNGPRHPRRGRRRQARSNGISWRRDNLQIDRCDDPYPSPWHSPPSSCSRASPAQRTPTVREASPARPPSSPAQRTPTVREASPARPPFESSPTNADRKGGVPSQASVESSPTNADRKGGVSNPSVTFTQAPNSIAVSINGQPFTTLYYDPAANKPYLHPLRSASGKIVSRHYPMENIPGEDTEHPHHRGIAFTHGNVNGYDFWASEPEQKTPKQGRILIDGTPRTHPGRNQGTMDASFRWVTPTGDVLLREHRVMTFHAHPTLRIIDFDITLTAAAGAVRFGDTKEGSFYVRLGRELSEDTGGTMTSSTGASSEKNIWGRRADWVDDSGTIGGESLGVAVFDHPGNPRHPAYWHSRAYGLLAVNIFGLHDFLNDKSRDGSLTLQPAQSIRFRYRVLVHPGSAAAANVAKLYEEYRRQPGGQP